MIGWCEQQRQLSAERQKALDAAAREAARLAEERKRLADEAEAKRALMEKRAAEEAAKYVVVFDSSNCSLHSYLCQSRYLLSNVFALS